MMRGQTLVVGYGVTGANAASHLLDDGVPPGDLAVVDTDPEAVRRATARGIRAIVGDGTDRHVFARVISEHLRCVVVAVASDEAAMLTTMLVRALCPSATIVTAVRENAHAAFARRHADHVITTSEAAGTALGHALREHRPAVTQPWTIEQRPVRLPEIGRPLHDCYPTAVGLVRADERHWGPQAVGLRLVEGDHIVLLRTRTEK